MNIRRALVDKSAIDVLRSMQSPDSPHLLDELVVLFAEVSKECLGGMELAIKNENGNQLKNFAHKYRSGCANLGLLSMVDLCKELELVAESLNFSQAKELYLELVSLRALADKELLKEIHRI